MSETVTPRPGAPLIARHAESMLWLARYMERIECLARLLDVTNTFARDADDTRHGLAILRINGDQEAFYARHSEANQRNVTGFYLLDAEILASVPAAMAAARENARTLRAIISTEMWLQINVFHTRIKGLTEVDLGAEHFTAVCAMLKEGTQAHSGITEGTFYRDQAWHFYMFGRCLERADQTTRLLDTRFNAMARRREDGDGAIDDGQWNTLLRAAAGYHAYRRVYPNGYHPHEVAGFLLLNRAFPRSVGLNLAQLDRHLRQLRARYHLLGGAEALARVDRLNVALTPDAVSDLVARRRSPFLDWLQQEIAEVHNEIVSGFRRG